YVDGHKAASDVRDEFVSVTEKLMDELAQCYNVLPQLDINNTIDHRPEGDEKWFLENDVSIFIPKLRLILILNSFLGSSDSLVFSELFHSLAPRPLAARSISDFLLTYLAT